MRSASRGSHRSRSRSRGTAEQPVRPWRQDSIGKHDAGAPCSCLQGVMRSILAHDTLEAPMMSERPVKKRAVNLFVDADLLDEARRMRINVSETLERRLRTIVRAEQEKRWLEENRDAIAAYNQRVATHGLLADDAALL